MKSKNLNMLLIFTCLMAGSLIVSLLTTPPGATFGRPVYVTTSISSVCNDEKIDLRINYASGGRLGGILYLFCYYDHRIYFGPSSCSATAQDRINALVEAERHVKDDKLLGLMRQGDGMVVQLRLFPALLAIAGLALAILHIFNAVALNYKTKKIQIRIAEGRCMKCGYPNSGTQDVQCPECGEKWPEQRS